MDDFTEITPFSECRYERLPVFATLLRYEHTVAGVTRAGANRYEGNELLFREIRATFDRDPFAHVVRDLSQNVVRDAITNVEDRCHGRWTIADADQDVFAALDEHFRPEQNRYVQWRSEQDEIRETQAQGCARIEAETARLQENAACRTWGLPELEPDPPGVAA